MTTLLTYSIAREYFYAAFSFFFLQLPVWASQHVWCSSSEVICSRMCLSMSRKEVIVGSSRELNMNAGERCTHTHTQRATAVSEEDSFAHSFSLTSPYILLWPRKFDFSFCIFWTPLPFPSLFGITLYSLKWWWDYIRDIKGNIFDSSKQW